MKKALMFLSVITLGMTLVLGGCGGQSSTAPGPAKDKPVVVKISHVVAESHASHIALTEVFKKQVEEKSGGRLKVEVYPNAQLGSDRQSIESVSMGNLEMTMPGSAVLSGFEEMMTVMDLPFLFKSKEAAFRALDGEFGAKLNQLLVKKNIVNLGYGDGGFRNITNSLRPIKKPEDLKGIKIRTMENPIHVATFKAFGANPTPMAFGELFTALQQGTVDAQENPINIIYTSKFHEVQKYLSLTGHVFGSAPILINKTFLESLPADLQKVLKDAATEAVKYQRQLIEKQDKEYIAQLKSKMQVNELTSEEKQLFINAAKTIYEDFEKKHGKELVETAMFFSK